MSLDGYANDGADSDGNGVTEEGDNVKTDVENVNGGLGCRLPAGELRGQRPGRLQGQRHAARRRRATTPSTASRAPTRVSGESGADRALYASRSIGVTVDIDGVADDGNVDDGPAGGTRDNVKTDVENLTGGSSDDVLRGNDGANSLEGGKGLDSLFGLGGTDSLFSLDGLTDRERAVWGGDRLGHGRCLGSRWPRPGADACESVTRE